MATEESSFAQRSREKLRFEHADMDYYLSWIVGRAVYGGSDRTECLDTAARIEDGDVASWQQAWGPLARRVEEEAEAALARGERAEARRAFLRACTYYRAPLFMMGPQEPAFYAHWSKMQACFRQAAALFDPPIEPVQVPFQGKLLAGYAWQVDGSGRPRPTLVVAGGLETFAEDCYFMVGPAATARGYNAIAVDLPGQGLNPDQGLHFEARMGEAVGAVVDYVQARPDVDAGRTALFGFSWGGHIAFQGARYVEGIRAMIANPPMPDVFRAAWAQQQGHKRRDLVTRAVFNQIAWRFGLKVSLRPGDLGRRLRKAYGYLRYGKVNPREVRCPVLCLAGEGEAPITLTIARSCIEQLPHPQTKLIIFTREQGGEAHCQVNNLPLPNTAIFDWLDEVFGPAV